MLAYLGLCWRFADAGLIYQVPYAHQAVGALPVKYKNRQNGGEKFSKKNTLILGANLRSILTEHAR